MLERTSDNTYRIAFNGQSHLINRDRLRLYTSSQQQQEHYVQSELQHVESELERLKQFELELRATKQAAENQRQLLQAHQQLTNDQRDVSNDLPHATVTAEVKDSEIVAHTHATAVYMQF